MSSLKDICEGLPTDPLPEARDRDDSVPHAPVRTPDLTRDEQRLALRNALRYFPQSVHETLAPEFADELRNYGHIYMYRFRPTLPMSINTTNAPSNMFRENPFNQNEGSLQQMVKERQKRRTFVVVPHAMWHNGQAYPIDDYPVRCRQAAAIMHMIMNNLDPRVAQFPHELVTYGGNGQVFSNWAQFLLVMKYLSEMTDEQTLVLYSGHPMGLFPSTTESPRAIITNGMVIPNYSSRETYEKMFALGVTMYGQMTAGSFCYIGPQGIVHGTTLTVLNAARKKLGTSNLAGKVFVTSGLGGMSGAQAKAAVICGCVGVIAEVSKDALYKRQQQGWVLEATDDLEQCIAMIRQAKRDMRATSIGYHGNIVDLWERLVEEYDRTGDLLADLGSDQTSCHNPYLGGYYPAELTYEESLNVMHENPTRFKNLVQESLRRHIAAVNHLANKGMYFWDYGNAFLLEAGRAGADVGENAGLNGTIFRYPSYVQDIMGDIFSLGFGPFRWVCTSADPHDLDTTDDIVATVLEDIINRGVKENVKQQYNDNIRWIKEASKNKMVVGSQARILYSDDNGRVAIATAFNKAVADGNLKGPVVISRDHHDVSGTDSPYRETSNIYDGSAFCADMAVQNAIGDAFRGATWVALHNGGGVGWGEVTNGGFGLVLDGSNEAGERAKRMLSWDVSNGVARRSWSGNSKAKETICRIMEENPNMKVTLPNDVADENLLDRAFKD